MPTGFSAWKKTPHGAARWNTAIGVLFGAWLFVVTWHVAMFAWGVAASAIAPVWEEFRLEYFPNEDDLKKHLDNPR